MTKCVSISSLPGQVLETGHEIMELDSSGFYTDIPTVFAGNMGGDQYIVQVGPTSVIVVQSGVHRTSIYSCLFKNIKSALNYNI